MLYSACSPAGFEFDLATKWLVTVTSGYKATTTQKGAYLANCAVTNAPYLHCVLHADRAVQSSLDSAKDLSFRKDKNQ
jgi:hypothetical protein